MSTTSLLGPPPSSSASASTTASAHRPDQLSLRVTPGQTLGGESASLPEAAPAMIGRIGPVQRTSATGPVKATVRRSDRIPEAETGGISVKATTTDRGSVPGRPPSTAHSDDWRNRCISTASPAAHHPGGGDEDAEPVEQPRSLWRRQRPA